MTTLQNKLTNKELMSYFGYGVGQCFSFGLVGSFILYFYTDILGISPIAASTIFLIARVWDAVNDPLIAGYMDTLDS
ncbi:MFS transporter, partial [Escherichia coli]|nr:MFS transporter [Escherichia coli]